MERTTTSKTHLYSGHCKVHVKNCKSPDRAYRYTTTVQWRECHLNQDIIVHRQTTILGDLDVRMPVFRRTKRGLLVLIGLLLSSILFAACNEPASILDTAGPVAFYELVMFWVIIVLAVIVFIGVDGALIYAIMRFRARPDSPRPRQLHGDMRLELLWTVIPSFLLLILLVATIGILVRVSPEAEPTTGPKVNVTAIGHQWWWEFYYNDYHFSTADSLVVPKDATVHVDLFSNNVIHSLWVPKVTGKTDVVPGHKNTKWFKVDKPGTYIGICAEYCGTQHANMKFNVVAKDPDAFETWKHGQLELATNPAKGTLADAGKTLFLNNCTSCHGIVGENAKSYPDTPQRCNGDNDSASDCPVGPNLTHFASRDLIAGGVLEHDSAKCADPAAKDFFETCALAKWLKDPQGIKPGNDMAIGPLSDDDIRKLVAYLETLK
jgi:cytochrome c oxidase subunit II